MKKKSTKKKRTKQKSNTKLARRRRLARATAAYYASLSGEALEEENRLGALMDETSSQINFDE